MPAPPANIAVTNNNHNNSVSLNPLVNAVSTIATPPTQAPAVSSSTLMLPPQQAPESSTNSSSNTLVQKFQWYDVGIVKGNQCTISGFQVPLSGEAATRYDPERDLLPHSPPFYTGFQKVGLSSGTAYKIRVAAINPCGRGPWSEVFTNLKTCLPGYPAAPTSIKITKGPEGAHISWSILNTDDILEYSVYLAIKNALPNTPVGTLSFLKVYSGPSASCIVTQDYLESAYLDQLNKPAIIFRIAARNIKGYGPATQVRWLQEQLAVAPIPAPAGATMTTTPSTAAAAGGGAGPPSRKRTSSVLND